MYAQLPPKATKQTEALKGGLWMELECLPHRHEAMRLFPWPSQTRHSTITCNPSSLVDAGRFEIQRHPQLYSEFEASLCYERNKTQSREGILRKTSNLAYI